MESMYIHLLHPKFVYLLKLDSIILRKHIRVGPKYFVLIKFSIELLPMGKRSSPEKTNCVGIIISLGESSVLYIVVSTTKCKQGRCN